MKKKNLSTKSSFMFGKIILHQPEKKMSWHLEGPHPPLLHYLF